MQILDDPQLVYNTATLARRNQTKGQGKTTTCEPAPSNTTHSVNILYSHFQRTDRHLVMTSSTISSSSILFFLRHLNLPSTKTKTALTNMRSKRIVSLPCLSQLFAFRVIIIIIVAVIILVNLIIIPANTSQISHQIHTDLLQVQVSTVVYGHPCVTIIIRAKACPRGIVFLKRIMIFFAALQEKA